MSNSLNIVMAQLNLLVGDIEGNLQKVIETATIAKDNYQADLVVYPELTLTGYPPEDLLLREDFHEYVNDALTRLAQSVKDVAVVVGWPKRTQKGLYNAVSVIQNGYRLADYHKHCLPNYGVFDEKRYFIRGTDACVVDIKGIKVGITICEDLWFPAPIAKSVAAGARVVVSTNASPFDFHKANLREKTLRARIQETPVPIAYVHGIGGQDEVVFDGGSIAMNTDGQIAVQGAYYAEGLFPVTLKQAGDAVFFEPQSLPEELSTEARAYEALKLGLRDYVQKNHFDDGVLIGLSGGIDSALTTALAVDALGADKVEVVMMPSQHTSELSQRCAQAQIDLLGVRSRTIDIEPLYQSMLSTLAPTFAGTEMDVTEENLQARARGVVLMALSNKFKKLVLTTSNKSESAVGYGTLYGDMAGGFSVLKDVPKTWVYRLSEYRNQSAMAIPREVIERAPTAELAPNQTDQDRLPPYDVLDEILERYVELDQSVEEIVNAGFDQRLVKKTLRMVEANEFKRRQAPPGIRITSRMFGRERRYPITNVFRRYLED